MTAYNLALGITLAIGAAFAMALAILAEPAVRQARASRRRIR